MVAIVELAREATRWRQDLHRHPELQFDLPRTSRLVARLLEEFGCDQVVREVGRTGVVGVIGGHNGPGPVIGLRADMDALPIAETTNLAYSSQNPGVMHACGHDGHTAMLLAAAKYLATMRRFCGTAIVIFQPAEEGGGGGLAMLEDGLMSRFGIEQIYALHNRPGLAVGRLSTRAGPILASGDELIIEVTGYGGHAGFPHLARDPVLAAGQLIVAVQAIISRTLNPLEAAVISLTTIHGGTAFNIVPDAVTITGTLRALSDEARLRCLERLREVCDGIGRAFGVEVKFRNHHLFAVTRNDAGRVDFLLEQFDADPEITIEANSDLQMVSEDFSFMLEKCPGAFLWIGNGDSAPLHHSEFNFNDECLIHGIRTWLSIMGAK